MVALGDLKGHMLREEFLSHEYLKSLIYEVYKARMFIYIIFVLCLKDCHVVGIYINLVN